MIEKVAQVLRGAERVLLLTHRGPDGDGLGSMVGCAEILQALGKKPVMMLPDGAAEAFQHLRGVKEAIRTPKEGTKFDATVVFDCGDPKLLQGSLPKPEVSGTVIAIDHHKASVEYGDLCWRDPSAAAVGVMIYRLAKVLGAELSKGAAEGLYVSIVSDTGWFRYSNTSAEVLRIAADLVDKGADPWATTQAMSESQPVERLLLLQRVLATVKISLGGRLATLEVTDSMLKECKASAEMVEGFVGYARGIRGVEVGALFSRKGTQVRASLRGRGKVDLGKLASGFGGGGHHDAAGFEASGVDLEVARGRFEQAVKEALEGEGRKA